MIVHKNSVGGVEVKAVSRFQLQPFSIWFPLGFWIVGAVKVVNYYEEALC